MVIVTKTCKRSNHANRVGINNSLYDNKSSFRPIIEHHRHFTNGTYENRQESNL